MRPYLYILLTLIATFSMTHTIETIALPAMSPGTQRTLKLHRYGATGARPKVHIQAALHADELSGMLASHHLLRLLNEAEARGAITGEILLVPVAIRSVCRRPC